MTGHSVEKKKPIDPSVESQQILTQMQFRTLHLVMLNAGRFPALDEAGKFEPAFKARDEMQVVVDPESRLVTALITLGLESGEGDMKQMEITALYRLIYSINPSYSSENLVGEAESFCRAHALAHVWPYWRELLASISLKMDLPPILAPLIVIGSRASKRPAKG